MAKQEYILFQVAQNIKQLYKQYDDNRGRSTINMKKERHILNNIKEKLINNNVTITKANKSNSIVVTYLDEYRNKIIDFVSNNNIFTKKNDITKTFQEKLRNLTNECHLPYVNKINGNT
jgi:hypothetical protein